MKDRAERQKQLKDLEAKGLDFARSTLSAVEFIGDTIRAESRHLATKAYEYVTAKLTGHTYRSDRDISLEPLAGIGSGSVGEDSLLR